MAGFRNNQWKDDSAIYGEEQVAAVLRHINIEIDGDTATHYTCFCPFHSNTDTSAFAVDKTSGLYYCFSPTCSEAGTLTDLVKKQTLSNEFQAQRIILKYKGETKGFAKRLKTMLDSTDDMPDVKPEVVNRLHQNYLDSETAQDYMKYRGFEPETMEYFKIGYSEKKNLISVPMHDQDGKPVGFIGRIPSLTEKIFKNSVNLPKARTCWNIHRAKRTGNVIIVCEASFDAMRIHQAGFPNVIALLGGSLTEYHINQINKYFDTIIIMTDFDELKFNNDKQCRKCEGKCIGHRAGRDLGRSIAEAFKSKRVFWGCYSDTEVFPNWVKDAGTMTDDEIRACIYNAKTNYEYSTKRMETLAPTP